MPLLLQERPPLHDVKEILFVWSHASRSAEAFFVWESVLMVILHNLQLSKCLLGILPMTSSSSLQPFAYNS